jgi:hypothetical protein
MAEDYRIDIASQDKGVGGMITRSRPEHDPHPYTMRAIYNQYCSENSAPELIEFIPSFRIFTMSDINMAIATLVVAHPVLRFWGCQSTLDPLAA